MEGFKGSPQLFSRSEEEQPLTVTPETAEETEVDDQLPEYGGD